MRAIQYFTDEQLAYNRQLTPTQIVQFLDDFRMLHGHAHTPEPIPPKMLELFDDLLDSNGLGKQSDQ